MHARLVSRDSHICVAEDLLHVVEVVVSEISEFKL
jgi:hypothetical protein